MEKKVLAGILLASLTAMPALAREYHRNPEVTRQFQHEHPCPSTGSTYGRCPGYIKDHVVPLCAGGADATWNMQWQTKEAAHAKDKLEWQQCHVPYRVWRQW